MFDWLSGKKAGETALDLAKTAASGIDMAILTTEEKIQYKQKAMDSWIKLQEILSNESSPRSVNRRLVAWAVVLNSLFILNLCIVLALCNINVDPVLQLVDHFKLGWAFVSVIIFYFGKHVIAAAANSKN